MSGGLAFAVLVSAAWGLACIGTSAFVAASWPWLRTAARRLRRDDRPLALLLVAVAPVVVGSFVLVVAASSSFVAGIDHCLDHLPHHPHHPHLCLRHAERIVATPALVLVALFAPLRLSASLVALSRRAVLMRRTMRSLSEASAADPRAVVFPDDSPSAFVLGLVRPQVYASSGLVSGDAEVLESVLAHERAHARRRDPLTRVLASFFVGFHLPFVARAIEKEVALAQELAADADAARELGDPIRIAHALLALARERTLGPVPSFTEGDLGIRVRALLEPPVDAPARSIWLGAIATTLAVATVIASPESIHHGIETVLGSLS